MADQDDIKREASQRAAYNALGELCKNAVPTSERYDETVLDIIIDQENKSQETAQREALLNAHTAVVNDAWLDVPEMAVGALSDEHITALNTRNIFVQRLHHLQEENTRPRVADPISDAQLLAGLRDTQHIVAEKREDTEVWLGMAAKGVVKLSLKGNEQLCDDYLAYADALQAKTLLSEKQAGTQHYMASQVVTNHGERSGFLLQAVDGRAELRVYDDRISDAVLRGMIGAYKGAPITLTPTDEKHTYLLGGVDDLKALHEHLQRNCSVAVEPTQSHQNVAALDQSRVIGR